MSTHLRPNGPNGLGAPPVVQEWWWVLRWPAWAGVAGGAWLLVRGWTGRSGRDVDGDAST
ncbi:hypothetical protein MO973_41475 [Paenibacillus sp. TRM 82003]|uniref:hypothetical protein n=1 Tax=Kineococcus sp. TRM81007 TaxID=2925831 RepID=UPI001F56D676|nr:hypothetical protein [Kineococcus sp. TRM81007]MCI2237808.1 hypothetical protein [Kineococcus sp. TRM81007]MCI3926665.1 hypothetical protein [Paenibacillus sp. TRM 82003]